MDHGLDLLITLTACLSVAMVFGYAAERLKLSPIVGYLCAGVLIGPFTPGYVAHRAIAEQFAEIGVILLMFGVGLKFHVSELIAVWRVVVPGALTLIGVTTLLGTAAARAFGWPFSSALVFGIAIAVSSTVVALRVLADRDALQTRAGHTAIGWLVVEDLFTVLVLVLMPVLARGSGGGSRGGIAVAIALAVLKIAALIGFTLLIGGRVAPWLLRQVVKTRSRELFTLTILALALGIAVGSAELFGASFALGAFLAGVVVGQSEFGSRAAAEALPMRDAFAVLFFVSMGMLFDPRAVLPNAGLMAVTLAIVVVGRRVVALAALLVLKQPFGLAVTVSFALGQVGEFSFIVAALGRSLGLLPEQATQALVVASIASITINQVVFGYAPSFARWLDRKLPLQSPAATAEPATRKDHAVLIGYGPVGRTVARLLIENGIEFVVVELNGETIRELAAQGIPTVSGDAEQLAILETAGLKNARSLIYTSSGSPSGVIAAARELNPKLLVVTRTTYVAEASALKQAGAGIVVAAEREVALAMTEALLREVGATPEQLDRERDRVRANLAEPD